MRFWWASQNKNYRAVIPNGTLWTRPRVDGVLPRNRAALLELAPDDIVFHYGAPYLRAVSRVVTSAIESPRPPSDYPRGPRETDADDDGFLAHVELIAADLKLHRVRVAELITWGTPGPLSRLGVPREAYISSLTDSDAGRLLHELDVNTPARFLPGRPHEDWVPTFGATDRDVLASVRLEQGALRAYLLDGRLNAQCAICARDTPKQMLVAGHIVPRSQLEPAARLQFSSVAMLVCLFGCDALFEHGFLVVDDEGRVSAGRHPLDPVTASEVAKRTGTQSPAWNVHTEATFRAHAASHDS